MGYGGRCLNVVSAARSVNDSGRTILIAAFCARGLRRVSFGALALPPTGLMYDGAGAAS